MRLKVLFTMLLFSSIQNTLSNYAILKICFWRYSKDFQKNHYFCSEDLDWKHLSNQSTISIFFKGDLRPKLHACFWDKCLLILRRKGERALLKVLWCFHQNSWSYKVTRFEFSVSEVMPANVQNSSSLVFFKLFFSFMEEKHPLKFYGVFYHLSRTYEVVKF